MEAAARAIIELLMVARYLTIPRDCPLVEISEKLLPKILQLLRLKNP
jgi:hypothetical protein